MVRTLDQTTERVRGAGMGVHIVKRTQKKGGKLDATRGDRTHTARMSLPRFCQRFISTQPPPRNYRKPSRQI